MSGSIREIGTEQAAEGTSIDGNRMSRMVRFLMDAWNNLRPRHIKRRWTPVTFSGGYTPVDPQDATQDNLPWLGAYNSTKQTVGTNPDAWSNPWRTKGNVVSGIDPTNPALNSADDLLTWTTSFYFRRPARLSGVFVGLIVDTAFDNTFQYGPSGGNIPPTKALNGYVNDWTVEVSVDDPHARENRKLNSVLYHRLQVTENGFWFSNITGAPTSAMTVVHPGGELGVATSKDSLVLVDQNVDMVIPQNSRVRFSITIPKYEVVPARADDYDTGWGNNGVVSYSPWQAQTYSWSLHFLEALEK